LDEVEFAEQLEVVVGLMTKVGFHEARVVTGVLRDQPYAGVTGALERGAVGEHVLPRSSGRHVLEGAEGGGPAARREAPAARGRL